MTFTEAQVDRRALQKHGELALLIDALGPDIKSVIEIGVHEGGTLATWRTAWPTATLVGIDIINPRELVNWKAVPHAHLVRGSSFNPLVQTEALRYTGRPVDLVFVDGDHLESSVRADWQLWRTVARWVAFHDIVHHPGWENIVQVEKVWRELKLARPTREFIVENESQWAGIGLVTGDAASLPVVAL